jgi:hypothetical protein
LKKFPQRILRYISIGRIECKASMPQTSEPSAQENHITKIFKKESYAVFPQESIRSTKKKEDRKFVNKCRLLGLMAVLVNEFFNQLAGGSKINAVTNKPELDRPFSHNRINPRETRMRVLGLQRRKVHNNPDRLLAE